MDAFFNLNCSFEIALRHENQRQGNKMLGLVRIFPHYNIVGKFAVLGISNKLINLKHTTLPISFEVLFTGMVTLYGNLK